MGHNLNFTFKGKGFCKEGFACTLCNLSSLGIARLGLC